MYNIEYLKSILIDNPVPRPPLPTGPIWVEYEFITNSLAHMGFTLHQFEPLQIVDKVGFLKTGDDAAEFLLDALQDYVQKQIAAGGRLVTQQDVMDAIKQGMASGNEDTN